MMNIYILVLLLALASWVPGEAHAQSVSITEVLGSQLDCDPSISTCQPIPLTVTVLCQVPSSCSRMTAPDWSNPDKFYGTDGTNCRKSIDGAVTWANCGSNPSATSVYFNYAVTMNGTVLAGGNDGGGTVTRIKRSIDGGATWAQVYNAAPVDGETATVSTGRLRCAQSVNVCMYVYREPGGSGENLVSTDDGQTWTLIAIGAVATGTGRYTLLNDGTLGIVIPPVADGVNYRAMQYDGATWTRSLIWPTSAGGSCNWSIVMNASRKGICHVGVAGTSYTLRSADGVIEKTFTLPDVPSDSGSPGVGMAASLIPNSIYLLRGDTAGKTGLWVSIDAGTTFVKLFATDTAGFGISSQGSIFKGANNCLYASYIAGGGSTILRVC